MCDISRSFIDSWNWTFPVPGTTAFKSHIRFRHSKPAKRKHCHVKLSVSERAILCFCKFWLQEVNNLPLQGLGVKIKS